MKGLSGVLKVFLFAVSLLGAHGIPGECSENCGDGSDTTAIVACHAKRYEKADRELNRVYSETMKSLSSQGSKN